uniref:Amine oxidase domain-containing protein n=1 Tax=Branchiostoma floridae TaxID=7739 RepID=C3Y5Q4_BRAFL|eukprot:XP_002608291.1 hypothetical protein BRAFLDRAFT_87971 [Branchiostoma floridae]
MASLSPKVTARTKVVIIGGGMAGISAAHRLTTAGWTDMKIVEARDRPGGRIWTLRSGPNIIELGANWIHGSEGNPIYKLATDHNLLKNSARFQKFDPRYRLRGDTFLPGGQVIDRKIVQEFLNMYEEVIEECISFYLKKRRPQHPDESVGGNINLPDGYDTVLDVLLRDIPSHCMLYNKQVKCVLWDQPPLPEKKLGSITRMGFGVVDKVFLEFEKPFWEAGSPGFQLVCKEDDTDPTCPKEWYKKLYIFYVDPKAPNTVFAWLSGEEALYMEALAEEEVAHTIVQVLRRFTGNDGIPLPRRLVRSRWGSDPLTCGSYSFMAVGANGEDIDTIAEPLYSQHTKGSQWYSLQEKPPIVSTTPLCMLRTYLVRERLTG